mmetsp:Transcript_34967/g.64750  ORF Transcript_34967/g.64750 Transcript_34967/m.64750 type:complete len:231 (-) Transcript_34967:401-1093(-)
MARSQLKSCCPLASDICSNSSFSLMLLYLDDDDDDDAVDGSSIISTSFLLVLNALVSSTSCCSVKSSISNTLAFDSSPGRSRTRNKSPSVMLPLARALEHLLHDSPSHPYNTTRRLTPLSSPVRLAVKGASIVVVEVALRMSPILGAACSPPLWLTPNPRRDNATRCPALVCLSISTSRISPVVSGLNVKPAGLGRVMTRISESLSKGAIMNSDRDRSPTIPVSTETLFH